MNRYIHGPLSARPTSPAPGTIYHDDATDAEYYFDSTWRQLPLSGDDPDLYVKKTDKASTSAFGVVKVGSGLSVSSGVVSAAAATASAIGGVKMAANVAAAAGEAPTAAEFKALLDALKAAGIMVADAAE